MERDEGVEVANAAVALAMAGAVVAADHPVSHFLLRSPTRMLPRGRENRKGVFNTNKSGNKAAREAIAATGGRERQQQQEE